MKAGAPRHIFGACQDVTDDWRMQEENLTRQKLETVGTLANGIVRDFNNLLGGVLGKPNWPCRSWPLVRVRKRS
jgi:hypothetical protein